MKYFLLICLNLVGLTFFAQKKRITFHLNYREIYCGGARPSEENATQVNQPKPYANKTIIILSEKGKADSAKTDEEGILKLRLRRGHYKLFEAWRYNLFTPEDLPIESFDRACLKKEWEKPIYVLEVNRKSINTVSVNPIIKFCAWMAPCLLNQEVPPGR